MDCVYSSPLQKQSRAEDAGGEDTLRCGHADVAGTLGIARPLGVQGHRRGAAIFIGRGGQRSFRRRGRASSFFQEYQWKLKNVYGKFYTEKARLLAEGRRAAAEAFYRSMLEEVGRTHREGQARLKEALE
jgi:uncharacterized protein